MIFFSESLVLITFDLNHIVPLLIIGQALKCKDFSQKFLYLVKHGQSQHAHLKTRCKCVWSGQTCRSSWVDHLCLCFISKAGCCESCDKI